MTQSINPIPLTAAQSLELSFVLPTEERWLHWNIHRTDRADPHSCGGFPYFGEAAELMNRWDLYSRNRVLDALRVHARLLLGDQLAHLSKERAVFIWDISFGFCHRIQEL